MEYQNPSNQNQNKQQKDDLNSNNYAYLIQWILNFIPEPHIEIKHNTQIKQLYTTALLYEILQCMSPGSFTSSSSIQQMENQFMQYFYEQFGYYVKPIINQKDRKEISMIRLMLYSCIYSQQKQKFVQKILTLKQQTQERLVKEIEQVQLELKNMKSWDRALEVVKKLEGQNNQLSQQISDLNELIEVNEIKIKSLQQELEETKKERNSFVIEKRKILSKYELSSFAEYEDLCNKLSSQNEELLAKQKDYLLVIKNLQQQVKSLQEGLNRSNQTIDQIASSYGQLKKSYDDLTRECSSLQQSIILLSENSKSLDNQTTILQRFKSECKSEDNVEFFCNNMTGTIKQTNSHHLQILECDAFLSSNSSNFSKKLMSRSSATDMFKATKQNVLMSQKIQSYEQQLQQLRMKIIELQAEITKYQDKQKYYLLKIRKIQRVSDGFKKQYEFIIGHSLSFE